MGGGIAGGSRHDPEYVLRVWLFVPLVPGKCVGAGRVGRAFFVLAAQPQFYGGSRGDPPYLRVVDDRLFAGTGGG